MSKENEPLFIVHCNLELRYLRGDAVSFYPCRHATNRTTVIN